MGLIFRYVRRHAAMVLIAMSFLLVETISDLLQPTLMSNIVDEGVTNRDVGSVFRWGGVMLAVAAVGAICAVARNYCSARAAQYIGSDLRLDAYRKVMSMRFDDVDTLQPGAIITRITSDVAQIQTFAQGIMRIMLKTPITCVGAIVLIIIQIPKQAPIVMVILAVAALLIWANMRAGFPRFLRVQRALDRLGSVSREFLRSVRVVKAFGMERDSKRKFDAAAGEFATANVSATRVSAVCGPLINLTVNIGIVSLLWLSRYQDPGHIGALMASMNYMTQVLFALGRVSAILNSAVRATASSRRIQEIFAQRSEGDAEGRAATGSDDGSSGGSGDSADRGSADRDGIMTVRPLNRPDADRGDAATPPFLRFDDVTFSYVGASSPALRDVDLTIRHGTTVGVIGPTGSGKSTLVSLIPRFYTPQSGVIRLEGHDLERLDAEELRVRIALVPQKPVLFTGTIRSNLLWGDAEADDKALREAIRLACADEFVDRLDGGLDARIGQGGVNLSGGQKQRLSLARALVRRPEILILDDCTSALDGVTEQRVLANLRRFESGNGPQSGTAASGASGTAVSDGRPGNGTTVILISQRISTVRGADDIVVMDSGRVAAHGTHDELMASSPQYRAIYDSQIGGDSDGGGIAAETSGHATSATGREAR